LDELEDLRETPRPPPPPAEPPPPPPTLEGGDEKKPFEQLSAEVSWIGLSIYVPIEDEGEVEENLAIEIREASARAAINGDFSQGSSGIIVSGLVVEREPERITMLEMAWIEVNSSLGKRAMNGNGGSVVTAVMKLCPLTAHVSESSLIFLGRLGMHMQVLTVELQHLLDHELLKRGNQKSKEGPPERRPTQSPNPLALGIQLTTSVESERLDVVLSLSRSGANILVTAEELHAGLRLEPDGRVSLETALAYASVTHQTSGDPETRATATYLMMKSMKRSTKDRAAWEQLIRNSACSTMITSGEPPHLWFCTSYDGSHLLLKAHVESTEWAVLASGLDTLIKLTEELKRENMDPGGQAGKAMSPAALAVVDVTFKKVMSDLTSDDVTKRRRGQKDISRWVMSYWPPPHSVGMEVNCNSQTISIPDHAGEGRPLGVVINMAGSLKIDGTVERNREHIEYISRSPFTIKMTGHDLQVAIRRVDIHHVAGPTFHPSHHKSGEARLLAPFSFSITTKIDLKLDPVRARNPHLFMISTDAEVSAIDIFVFLNTRAVERILNKALAPLLAAKAAKDGAAEEARRVERESKQWEAYLINKSPIAGPKSRGSDRSIDLTSPSSSSSSSHQSVVAKDPYEQALLLTTVKFRWTMKSVRLTAINNLCKPSSPLFQLIMSHFSVSNKVTEGKCDGKVDVKVHGRYFNRRLALWEPLVEPWEFSVMLGGGYFPQPVRSIPSGELSTTTIAAVKEERSDISLTTNGVSSNGNGTSEASHAASSCTSGIPQFLQQFVSVRLISHDTLNVNMSEVFLESLVSAATALAKRARRGQKDRHGDQMSLYWIRNDTGVILSYQAEPYTGTVEQVRYRVEPGEEQVLNVVSTRENSSLPHDRQNAFADRAMTAFQDRVVLALQRKGGSPWPSLLRVSLEEEGVELHPLRRIEDSSGKEDAVWLACEVSQSNGVKLLRVRSTLLFHNTSSLPLLIQLVAYDVVQWEVRVEPGTEVPLPLHLTPLESQASLNVILEAPIRSLRPISSSQLLVHHHHPSQSSLSDYQPASLEIPPSRVEMPAPLSSSPEQWSSTLSFSCPKSADKSIYCVVELERDIDSKGQVIGPPGHNRVLTFHAPYLLTNLLPQDMEFILLISVPSERPSSWWNSWARHIDDTTASNTPASVRGCLRPGESFPWYAASVEEHDVSLSIRMASFEWSPPIVIAKAGEVKTSKYLQSLEQVDQHGDVLTTSVEVASRAHGKARELSVFVPYWIINTTALPLQFGPDPHDEALSQTNRNTGHQQTILAGQSLTSTSSAVKRAAAAEAQEVGGGGDVRKFFRRPGVEGLRNLVPVGRSKSELLLAHMHAHVVMVGVPAVQQDGIPDTITDAVTETKKLPPRLRMRCAGARWSQTFMLSRSSRLLGFYELSDRNDSWWWSGRGKKARVGALDLSVAVHQADGAFSRTMVVTVSAKFLLVNAFGRGLELRQDGIPPRDVGLYPNMSLPAGQEAPFYWSCKGGSRLLRVRVREFGWEWSGKFSPDVEGDTILRLRNTHTDVKCLLQVRRKENEWGRGGGAQGDKHHY